MYDIHKFLNQATWTVEFRVNNPNFTKTPCIHSVWSTNQCTHVLYYTAELEWCFKRKCRKNWTFGPLIVNPSRPRWPVLSGQLPLPDHTNIFGMRTSEHSCELSRLWKDAICMVRSIIRSAEFLQLIAELDWITSDNFSSVLLQYKFKAGDHLLYLPNNDPLALFKTSITSTLNMNMTWTVARA